MQVTFTAADQSEHQLGNATPAEVTGLIDQVPWVQERRRADEHKQISPTLKLETSSPPAFLALSVLGTAESLSEPLEFVAMFENEERYERTRWFRRQEVAGRVNYDMEGVSLEQAKELAVLFASEAYSELAARFPRSRRRILNEQPVRREILNEPGSSFTE